MIKKIFIGSILFFAIAYTSYALDVTPPAGQISLPQVQQDPGETIASIIKYFVLLTGVITVMTITWWGIGFILSVGDDEKMKKSRKTIIYAFVWLVISGLAYSIVEIITRANIN